MSERTRLHYPTVYVVHTEDKNRYKSVPDYTVYVGETKVAAARDRVENGMTKTEAWPGTGSRASWIGNGVLDGFLEDKSLFGEFLWAPVSEGGPVLWRRFGNSRTRIHVAKGH